jgi:hypothetical protein
MRATEQPAGTGQAEPNASGMQHLFGTGKALPRMEEVVARVSAEANGTMTEMTQHQIIDVGARVPIRPITEGL